MVIGIWCLVIVEAMSLLNQIIDAKRTEIAQAQATVPLYELKRRLGHHRRERDLTAALRQPGQLALIAELKRQSPSRGVIRERFDPITIAQTYQSSGASALSILTDARYFGGHLSFLRDVKSFSELPILRKDFIIDEYQVYESAWAAADAILLIARIVEPDELRRLAGVAQQLQLDVLAEVHNEAELDAVLAAGCRLIGINHRDLDTFTMDLTLSQRLIPRIPKECTIVAESGLHTREDVQRMCDLGVHAVLIGEAFMEAPDIAAKMRELMG